jgi:hypothetical protein
VHCNTNRLRGMDGLYLSRALLGCSEELSSRPKERARTVYPSSFLKRNQVSSNTFLQGSDKPKSLHDVIIKKRLNERDGEKADRTACCLRECIKYCKHCETLLCSHDSTIIWLATVPESYA